MRPIQLIGALWGLWLVTWVAAALWSDRTVARPAFREELPSRTVTIVGAVLIASGRNGPMLDPRLGWALAALALAGLAFSWWARIHLGRLWSGHVTRKEGHRIVDTGPYALVRHPIYTGAILALFATAFALARPLAVLGAALISYGFYKKARLEERFLRAGLGADGYDAYARRVPMLIPFRPRKG
jgi:protein-S-isoprenylcysteine O-methyltransferase Ste14